MDSSLVSDLPASVRSTRTSFEKWYFVLRLFIVSFFMTLVVTISLTGMGLPNTEVNCLWDALFVLTGDLNAYFADNEFQRHLMLIISSALIDFQVLYLGIRYLFTGKSWRTPIALFSFYLFRALVQSVFIMQFPEGYLWDYPGIFSLTVSYHRTPDFFFSGHLGFTIICTCENIWLGKRGLAALSLLTACTEAIVMVICRGHYTIDLIAGVVFGHYCWILSGIASKSLDEKMKGLQIEPKDEYIRLA
jgi:hypothetical protein